MVTALHPLVSALESQILRSVSPHLSANEDLGRDISSNFTARDSVTADISRKLEDQDEMGKPSKSMLAILEPENGKADAKKISELVVKLIESNQLAALRYMIDSRKHKFDASALFTAIDSKSDRLFDLVFNEVKSNGLLQGALLSQLKSRVKEDTGEVLVDTYNVDLSGFKRFANDLNFEHAKEQLAQVDDIDIT